MTRTRPSGRAIGSVPPNRLAARLRQRALRALPACSTLCHNVRAKNSVSGLTMRHVAVFACAVMLICVGVLPSYAEKRVALVIGNDRYVNLPANQQLRKAGNDARAVGDALPRPVVGA